LRRLGRLLGWFVVINALITIFGVTTAPLLLFLVADAAVGWLVISSLLAHRRSRKGMNIAEIARAMPVMLDAAIGDRLNLIMRRYGEGGR
jgi:hypothetical protein